ncbi:hypothetical protein [Vulgatibacter incomptus]|uniref:hypothetical protein n=1 Tax=Vulgatibacter incomptus TaxID=1391653 RepID=UPI001969D828|nr:hypothetical protein [Vulgatibacter incomptus]
MSEVAGRPIYQAYIGSSANPGCRDLSVPVLLKVGDDLTTDEILPAGTPVLPYRSNIPKISEFAFDQVDPTYAARAMKVRDDGGHVVIGGSNYGQGSSREHAALAPRYLGLRAVIAKSFARIHSQNLVNFGIAPLTFVDPGDYEAVSKGDTLSIDLDGLESGKHLQARADGRSFFVTHSLSPRQVDILRNGGLINWMKERLGPGAGQKVER